MPRITFRVKKNAILKTSTFPASLKIKYSKVEHLRKCANTPPNPPRGCMTSVHCLYVGPEPVYINPFHNHYGNIANATVFLVTMTTTTCALADIRTPLHLSTLYLKLLLSLLRMSAVYSNYSST